MSLDKIKHASSAVNLFQLRKGTSFTNMSANYIRPKLEKVSHIIFDFDGLVVDTEMWAFHHLNSLLRTYGKECSLESYSKQVGIVPSDRVQGFIDEFQLKCDAQTFFDQWRNQCFSNAQDLKLMPGIKRLTKHLHKYNIPMAISASGKKYEYYARIKHLGDIFEDGKYFNHVVHGDDSQVKYLKPHPDLFQVCASKFSPVPDPENILVFDDTIIGVSAAIAAGMQSALVWDKRFGGNVYSNATLVINSLEEFKPEFFGLPTFQNVI